MCVRAGTVNSITRWRGTRTRFCVRVISQGGTLHPVSGGEVTGQRFSCIQRVSRSSDRKSNVLAKGAKICRHAVIVGNRLSLGDSRVMLNTGALQDKRIDSNFAF